MSYICDIGIGNPPTSCLSEVLTFSTSIADSCRADSLIVDTRSSNTWVGTTKPYVPTSLSHKTSNTVAVLYACLGTFQAMNVSLHLTFRLYCTLTFLPVTDDVKLGAVTIKGQSIGIATKSVGFNGVNWILGICPVDVTVGTLSPDTSLSILTVIDVCATFLSRVIASNAVLCTEPQATNKAWLLPIQ